MEGFVADRLGGRSEHRKALAFLLDEFRAIRDELTQAMENSRHSVPPFYKHGKFGWGRETAVDALIENLPECDSGVGLNRRFGARSSKYWIRSPTPAGNSSLTVNQTGGQARGSDHQLRSSFGRSCLR